LGKKTIYGWTLVKEPFDLNDKLQYISAIFITYW